MRYLAAIAFLTFILQTTFAVAEDVKQKTFSKDGLSLNYPETGWELSERPPAPGKTSTNLVLTAKGTPKLSLVVTWEKNLGEMNEQEKDTPSAVFASAFGLPIALGLAGNKKEQIVSSVGLINLADYSSLSSRYIVVSPDSPKTMNVESFTLIPEAKPGNMVVGAIISEGNQNPQALSNDYFDRLYDAYGIVQSISLK